MKKIINFATTVLMLVSLMSFSLAHTGEDEFGHHGMMGRMMAGGYGYGASVFGWVFMTLVLIILVLLIAWLIKQLQEPVKRK